MMPSQKQLAAVGASLLLGMLFNSPAAFATTVYTSNIEATTNLNGTFPPPNPRNQDSSLISSTASSGGDAVHATAGDSYTYTPPPGSVTTWTVSGIVNADVSVGTIKLNSQLSATKNNSGPVSMTSLITGFQTDLVTIVSAPDNGQIKVSDLIDGSAYGSGTTWSSDVSLQVTITNIGINGTKNLTYNLSEEHKRSSNGQSDSASGPTLIPVSVGDMLAITMNEALTTTAESNVADTYVNASYGHTTHLYIDSATAGVSFTALSGHDYASPVPLPPAWELLSIGLLMIPGIRRLYKASDGVLRG